MRDEYGFSQAMRNPYVIAKTNTVTLSLDSETLKYFKNLGQELDKPYPELIARYLKDCAAEKRGVPA